MPTYRACLILSAVVLAAGAWSRPAAGQDASGEPANFRQPKGDAELRYWLENMVWYHHFTDREITAAMGLAAGEIAASRRRFDIRPERKPLRRAHAPLLVLPYPGGRHPRIGFLDGAVRPQRETKISVFTPWDERSYVVVDVPEAIWSNLGLTYLAHTHVPTVWTKQKVTLKPLEWNRRPDGSLEVTRKLPNGIVFTSKVRGRKDSVRMQLTLTNGTGAKLTDLRVQNCTMLKGASGFTSQKQPLPSVVQRPYIAMRATSGKLNRWIITAWDPCHRPWSNPPCPCFHSDPKFPDCEPGQTQRLVGWLSFYKGDDVRGEFERIEKTGWRERTE